MPNVRLLNTNEIFSCAESQRLSEGVVDGLPAFPLKCRKGHCGTCMVEVVDHPDHISIPDPREATFLNAMKAKTNQRLACQARVLGDLSLNIVNLQLRRKQ